MPDNQNIVDIYKNELDKFPLEEVLVSSIHNNQDICFNAFKRETLYAIQKCFKESNEGKSNSFFKETRLGKCVQININLIPKNPPFENIITHYIKYFRERINLIEKNFKINKINFKELEIEKDIVYNNKDIKYKKLKMLNKYYNILFCKKLPNVVLIKILSYIIFDDCQYEDLREKYEKYRKIEN